MKRYLIIYVSKDGEFHLHNVMADSIQEALEEFGLYRHQNPPPFLQEIYSITLAR